MIRLPCGWREWRVLALTVVLLCAGVRGHAQNAGAIDRPRIPGYGKTRTCGTPFDLWMSHENSDLETVAREIAEHVFEEFKAAEDLDKVLRRP